MIFDTTSYILVIINLSLLILYCSSFKFAIIDQTVVTIKICWIPSKTLSVPTKTPVGRVGSLSHSNQPIEFPNTLYLILPHSPSHSVGLAFCRRHHHHRGHPPSPSLPQPPNTAPTVYLPLFIYLALFFFFKKYLSWVFRFSVWLIRMLWKFKTNPSESTKIVGFEDNRNLYWWWQQLKSMVSSVTVLYKLLRRVGVGFLTVRFLCEWPIVLPCQCEFWKKVLWLYLA